MHVKLLSHVQLFVTPWTVTHQEALSMGFSRQEYWSGLPFPSPRDLPDPGIKPECPALQADSLSTELSRKFIASAKNRTDSYHKVAALNTFQNVNNGNIKCFQLHSEDICSFSSGLRNKCSCDPWKAEEMQFFILVEKCPVRLMISTWLKFPTEL